MARQMKAVKLPSNELALMNAVVVNGEDFPESEKIDHLLIHSNGQDWVMTLLRNNQMKPGEFGLGNIQRKWAEICVDTVYAVTAYKFQSWQYLSCVTFEVDFYAPVKTSAEAFDTDEMARQFVAQFAVMALTKGQHLVFSLQGRPNLKLTVKALTAIDVSGISDGKAKKAVELLNGVGVVSANMDILFERAEKSAVNLTGKSVAMAPRTKILNPEWNFQKMGVGGLDKEFSIILRRAFASRLLPLEFIEKFGLKHVRGLLLFGPPGTGKTLIARQIGKMLSSREPQIVSGPSVLDKFVGESEANIRKLFAPAEEEEKRLGRNSGLHIIIFDEIDVLCKQRGSASGSSGVHDNVVSQLMAKMDGVDQLNNILVIGMTNRRDMIDEAMLRPGRMEVQVEVGLPDELGRREIFKIHTATMRKNNKLACDVDIKELAKKTENYSGAEIEGLVRAAQSTAIKRLIKATGKVEVDADGQTELLVSRDDFFSAIATDIKPAFGSNDGILDVYLKNGIIIWDKCVQTVLDTGEFYVDLLKIPNAQSDILSLLLEGPAGSGKTALVAQICRNSGFSLVKVFSPLKMASLSELAKCVTIEGMFNDAYKSEFSCILVDDLEVLIGYNPTSKCYSVTVLNCLRSYLKNIPPKGRKLLVICTTGNAAMLDKIELKSVFSNVSNIRNITTSKQLISVLSSKDTLTLDDVINIGKQLTKKKLCIGIKQLLILCKSLGIEQNQRVEQFMKNLELAGSIKLENTGRYVWNLWTDTSRFLFS